MNNKQLRTDLILEQSIPNNCNNIVNKEIIKTKIKDNNYTTIKFNDITDNNNFKKVENLLINSLKEYITNTNNEIFLIIGLGNDKSTPDSLGPEVIDRILVTRYLFLLGEVEEGYSNVCSFTPNVMGNTGIETSDIIKSIIKETKATKVIIIDSLKTNSLDRLVKTIQISDKGISPGSGIGNKRKEISKHTMGIDIIAIGVPTVVDINSIINNKKEENLIVTPTDIDFIIEKLSILISNSINKLLHNKY